MRPIKKILHPTDFSEGASAALDHACHLARHHEAALHVLHVVPIFGDSSADDETGEVARTGFEIKLQQEGEQNMQALVEAHSYRDVSLTPVLSQGVTAGPVILEYAESEGIDIIVMGTHGRRGIRHLLLGSVAEEVIHKASCDVLSVRMLPDHGDEAHPIQRILVPLDLAEQSRGLVAVAKRLAAGYGAELHLMHVIQPLPYSVTLLTPTSIYELVPEISDKARAYAEKLYASAGGPEVPYTIHITEGPVAKTVVEAAVDRQVDLICMASRQMGGLERLFLGSVTERVVRTASCPVYVARVSGQAAASSSSAEAAATATS
ncbi:MAG TPA: universal stress protein [Rhodothermales bacterium]|nr:universal stress protein [Rhodothermales bacterium]